MGMVILVVCSGYQSLHNKPLQNVVAEYNLLFLTILWVDWNTPGWFFYWSHLGLVLVSLGLP